jgi:hypothetical protein
MWSFHKVGRNLFQRNINFFLLFLFRTGGEAVGCVIVTDILPKDQLFALNQFCRENGIVFIMGLTSGVTATVFSDFGDEHIVNDIDGEPTEAFAINICEVIPRHACNFV